MSIAVRVARLERDIGAQAGACPACVRAFVTRRVDRDATPEQIDAARRCASCEQAARTESLSAAAHKSAPASA